MFFLVFLCDAVSPVSRLYQQIPDTVYILNNIPKHKGVQTLKELSLFQNKRNNDMVIYLF